MQNGFQACQLYFTTLKLKRNYKCLEANEVIRNALRFLQNESSKRYLLELHEIPEDDSIADDPTADLPIDLTLTEADQKQNGKRRFQVEESFNKTKYNDWKSKGFTR